MNSMEYLKNNTIKSRYFTIHHNNGICFNDNTARASLQKKAINVINRSSANCLTIQMYPARMIGNYLMHNDEYATHKMNAGNYFKAAKEFIVPLNQQDRYGTRVVAHHNGTNMVCPGGSGLDHAEIQILKAFPNKPCLEMGITSPMCYKGQYKSFPAGCKQTIQDNYEANKIIFVKDPSGFYMFPYKKSAPIGEDNTFFEYRCDLCNKRLTTDKNFCEECEQIINDDNDLEKPATV